ncbi:MAG: polymerase subunit gamma/tau [Herminiimonas sp.]|nr:polymerase subunit gamma/tau [Herminiimonas sp.]
MSYQVLARKYRPKSFDTLVGQEHVVRALTHALEQKRLHHAYLFTGTRGVGKTTLSRILAKSFNCQGPDGNGGITAQPCGVCDACTAIDAGRFVDYIEMDAASNRGVDEMAQLLEQAVYAPSNARFKVYMIDEVHMLTNHAFNSMLKTLEEPPEHVKFILATTDPQKIPVTVLSRCLQFNLKQMPPGHIVGHLENILGQENIAFDTPALRLLAQGAHGSMRDALSLTDQAIAYAAGRVTLEAVQGMLGALDQSYLIRVLDALAIKDGAGLLTIADEMATRSLSYNAALQDLGVLLHRIALAQTVPSAVPEDLPERADVMRLATAFDAEEVQLFYQIAVHGRNELGLAPDEYAGFSMTLLRMLAFRPGIGGAESKPAPAAALPSAVPASASAPARSAAPAAAAAATIPRTSAGLSPARAALEAARGGSRPQQAPVAAAPAPSKNAAEAIVAPWEDFNPEPAERPASDSSSPAAQKKTESGVAAGPAVEQIRIVTIEENEQQPIDAQQAPTLHPVSALNWDGNWPQLAAALPVRGVVQQLAQQSELVKCGNDGGNIQFHLKVPVETLCSAGSIDKLAAALSEHFGQPIRVNTEVGAVRQTANAQALAERAARQREAEQTMQSDPFVQTLMREFGATIVPGSIKPV